MNLGIGGDQTGHVLWRITEGKELEPIKPKLAVIMIGTNNMGGHSAEKIAGGVKAIVEELRKQKPEMKILLLGIFPRSAKAEDKVRDKIKESERDHLQARRRQEWSSTRTSARSSSTEDGTLEKKIMPDLLHLSPEGYEIWADAIKDDVAETAEVRRNPNLARPAIAPHSESADYLWWSESPTRLFQAKNACF